MGGLHQKLIPFTQSREADPNACTHAAFRMTLPEIEYEKFTLDNGLTVVVHEDHKAPIVAVNVWYHVGSKNEPTGRSGFAHLFEHLMFNGSEHFSEPTRPCEDIYHRGRWYVHQDQQAAMIAKTRFLVQQPPVPESRSDAYHVLPAVTGAISLRPSCSSRILGPIPLSHAPFCVSIRDTQKLPDPD